jgi:hypothetical protein
MKLSGDFKNTRYTGVLRAPLVSEVKHDSLVEGAAAEHAGQRGLDSWDAGPPAQKLHCAQVPRSEPTALQQRLKRRGCAREEIPRQPLKLLPAHQVWNAGLDKFSSMHGAISNCPQGRQPALLDSCHHSRTRHKVLKSAISRALTKRDIFISPARIRAQAETTMKGSDT